MNKLIKTYVRFNLKIPLSSTERRKELISCVIILHFMQPDGDSGTIEASSDTAWFVGKLTRNECEELLMQHGHQQHFVLRESTNLVRILTNFGLLIASRYCKSDCLFSYLFQ
jgi:SH2 domain